MFLDYSIIRQINVIRKTSTRHVNNDNELAPMTSLFRKNPIPIILKLINRVDIQFSIMDARCALSNIQRKIIFAKILLYKIRVNVMIIEAMKNSDNFPSQV